MFANKLSVLLIKMSELFLNIAPNSNQYSLHKFIPNGDFYLKAF